MDIATAVTESFFLTIEITWEVLRKQHENKAYWDFDHIK